MTNYWPARFSACQFPGRPNTRHPGGATGRWGSARPLWFPGGRAGFSPRDGALLRPARRRVLPRLLTPVDAQVEQVVVVIHHLDAATRRPISLEDFRSLAQVADEMHPADSASNQQSL